MGEAAAMLVLEELEHARARGAKVYAEVLGYGVSSDASHVSEPDPSGANPARAMRMAFADAGIEPGDVDYVNAHGTSTPSGDAAETRVLKLALGEEKAFGTPVSSTKGATGHCLGAAGAVEAIFTIFALQQGVLPPTINYETPDPECDLDYIPNEARPQHIEIGVNNSFGFGGHNACVVFRRWGDGSARSDSESAARAGPCRATRRRAARCARGARRRGIRAARGARGLRRSPGKRSSGSSRSRPASALRDERLHERATDAPAAALSAT